MANYKSFAHVERLGKTETDGILNGFCDITPKLDGTNAVLWWDKKDNCVGAGSRARKLSETKDNAGFFAWANSDNDEAIALGKFLTINQEIIVYGEWGVGQVGNIKDYDPRAKGFLWIFDMYNVMANCYLTYDAIKAFAETYGFDQWLVPRIAQLHNPTKEEILEIAKNNHFLLENANHPGEGVVIRNYEFRDVYGHYQIAKLVLDEYKQRQGKPKNKAASKRINCEQNIVDVYLTDAEMAKAKAKVTLALRADEFDIRSGKFIGMYLNMCFNDAIIAEIADIVKKYKHPVIDFQMLKDLAFKKARDYIGL